MPHCCICSAHNSFFCFSPIQSRNWSKSYGMTSSFRPGVSMLIQSKIRSKELQEHTESFPHTQFEDWHCSGQVLYVNTMPFAPKAMPLLLMSRNNADLHTHNISRLVYESLHPFAKTMPDSWIVLIERSICCKSSVLAAEHVIRSLSFLRLIETVAKSFFAVSPIESYCPHWLWFHMVWCVNRRWNGRNFNYFFGFYRLRRYLSR